MKYLKFTLLLLALVVLAGCARQTDVDAGEIAGFWFGTWNSMTVFISFIGSWFSEDILIYYPLNKGFLYDLGFLFGLSIIINLFKIAATAVLSLVR